MRARVMIANGNIVRETEKAVLFDFDFAEVWLPKSQIKIDLDREQYNALGILTLPIWLAKKAGLWGYDSFGNPVCGLVDG